MIKYFNFFISLLFKVPCISFAILTTSFPLHTKLVCWILYLLFSPLFQMLATCLYHYTLYIVQFFKCFLFLASKENYTFCILLWLYYFNITFETQVTTTVIHSSLIVHCKWHTICSIKHTVMIYHNIFFYPIFLYLFVLYNPRQTTRNLWLYFPVLIYRSFLGFIPRCEISTTSAHLYVW